MNAPPHIAELMSKRIAHVRRKQIHLQGTLGHPFMAILVATLEGAIECGLVEPLQMSVEDSAGTVIRSTIQGGNISYDDDNGRPDFQFPLRVVVTDEGGNDKVVVNVETEEIGDDWNFRIQVYWL